MTRADTKGKALWLMMTTTDVYTIDGSLLFSDTLGLSMIAGDIQGRPQQVFPQAASELAGNFNDYVAFMHTLPNRGKLDLTGYSIYRQSHPGQVRCS